MKKLFLKYKEIIMYVVFGGLTTLVSLLSYSLFAEGFLLSITLSSALSWVIAVSFAFVTNKIFVFESKSFKPAVFLREAISFLAARLFSGVIEIFLPEILFNIGLDFELFGVKGLLSKLVVNIIVIILNYILSKLIVFRKER